MKSVILALSGLAFLPLDMLAQIPQESIRWDEYSLVFDGKRVVPVMGEDFNPRLSLDKQIIEDLFVKSAPAVDMFTKDSPDELKPKLK